MMANVTCPACQHKYWIDEGEMGSRQICPNCQSPFFAGASVAAGRPAPPPSAGAAAQASYAKTMIGDTAPPIKYNCPRCKAALEAAASEAGTKKNCPNCTQRLQVPAAPKPEPAAAPNLNKTMLASDESTAPPRPPIKYNCPNCKKPLEAPAEQGGTKTNCPSCHQRLQIPAAPVAPNLNKTMLAGDQSAAGANAASHGVASGDGVRGASPAAAGPVHPPGRWAALLTPRNVAIGIVVLLLLFYFVPAFIRGGKEVDKDALAKTQMELEKLRGEIDLKNKEMELRAKAEADAQQRINEMIRQRNAEDEKRRQEEQKRLRDADDEEARAKLKRQFAEQQQQREREKQELDRQNKEMLADVQRQLAETKKALETSQQKQQTIIQQPAPVVTYPPYSPWYYRPWWW